MDKTILCTPGGFLRFGFGKKGSFGKGVFSEKSTFLDSRVSTESPVSGKERKFRPFSKRILEILRF